MTFDKYVRKNKFLFFSFFFFGGGLGCWFYFYHILCELKVTTLNCNGMLWFFFAMCNTIDLIDKASLD